MARYQEFQFIDYIYQSETGTLRLHYGFKDGPGFVETIHFPSPRRDLDANETLALDKAFRLIFLLAGVSYYKAYVPERLVCLAFPLSSSLAAFCQDVYVGGLGEFAFCNKIRLDFRFVADLHATDCPVALALSHRVLVPVGGGKDSIVSIEALRKGGVEQMLVACGGENLAAPIAQTISVSGLPHLQIKRFLSPVLMELNKQDALNGHVPITAILSSVFVACAILYGFDHIALSNESSASEPNVITEYGEVNHQYSKSSAFERGFNEIVKSTVSPNITYFSLLRPLTETAIASRFAKLEAYHPVFRSCNTAFRQDESLRGKKWCCNCPKCRFVFLALAPFLSKEKLVAIFGANLLEQEDQLEGFKELCGLGPHKPFECVGEVKESALLMLHLSGMPPWRDALAVSALSSVLQTRYPNAQADFEDLFAMQSNNDVPQEFLGALNDE